MAFAMNFHQFDVENKEYCLIPAGFSENGCEAYEVLDERDEFVTTVFCSPLQDLAEVAHHWANELQFNS